MSECEKCEDVEISQIPALSTGAFRLCHANKLQVARQVVLTV